jgi:hypothetical protein
LSLTPTWDCTLSILLQVRYCLQIEIYSCTIDTSKTLVRKGHKPEYSVTGINFLNSIAMLDENTVLMTESSTKWDERRHMYIVLEAAGDGRYDVIQDICIA